jgi:CRP-like cAMP-binding protein
MNPCGFLEIFSRTAGAAMALEHDIMVLENVPLLGDLGRDALRLLAFSAQSQQLRPGDVLFERGSPADGGVVLVSGRLVLLMADGSADKLVGPATLLGELALIIENKRQVTAIAREPSRVLHIPRVLFHRMLGEYPDLAKGLRNHFASNLRRDAQAMETIRQRMVGTEGQ